jgi:protein involved in temperature-dependent protein secretion
MPVDGVFDHQPSSLRERAAKLVGEGQIEAATELINDGLKTHPRDEHLLVMCALLCEVRRDWYGADRALQELIAVQGYHAPAETWSHWIRVLRCLGQWEKAWTVANQSLELHPSDLVLQSEHDTLKAIVQSAHTATPV